LSYFQGFFKHLQNYLHSLKSYPQYTHKDSFLQYHKAHPAKPDILSAFIGSRSFKMGKLKQSIDFSSRIAYTVPYAVVLELADRHA